MQFMLCFPYSFEPYLATIIWMFPQLYLPILYLAFQPCRKQFSPKLRSLVFFL
ncbi:hypothetical protein MtrunA17_Chr5g0429241 [Medicago truncatula]|uniref:Transmembrane protein n=1 Tax=Medicago truncatula TaxID=3880 RepID=I3SXK9_MEDTR|nr:unknown [Medicago truncatula]RHN56415.1 hypothetical protein MtrunA17_Chr5g0429241 [Medicago truncatula]